MSERTFRRWSVRFEEEGEAGLFDRRVGESSGKPVPADRGGMMLHQDGSRHAWREGLPALDLLNPLSRKACRHVDKAPSCPRSHGSTKTHEADILMCHQDRTA